MSNEVYHFKSKGQALVFTMLEKGISIPESERVKIIEFLDETLKDLISKESGVYMGLMKAIDILQEECGHEN